MLVTTPKDLFWLVLSFIVLWVGIFAGLGLFYFVMMARDMTKVTASFRKKLELVDQIMKIFKDRMEKTANFLPPLIEGVSKLVQRFKEKEKKSKKK